MRCQTCLALILTGCGPSALTPIAAGGSGEHPWVIATGTRIDNISHRRTGQEAEAVDELYVYEPASSSPVRTFKAPPATSAIGAIGDRVWLMSGQEPFLIDAKAGSVVFGARELGDRHAQIAGGARPTGHGHPGFEGPVHRKTGDLGLLASGAKVVLTTKGDLVPFEDYLAEHPAEIPTELVCRGGRTRVCGSDICVKFVPDPSGGERLEVSASPLVADGVPKAESEPMFAPKLVGDTGCVRRLGGDGPLVVTHRSKPRRDAERDQISAVDLAGETVWTVGYGELYGDRERRADLIDVVENRVVTGVNVKSGMGVAIAVATIDVSGVATAAP